MKVWFAVLSLWWPWAVLQAAETAAAQQGPFKAGMPSGSPIRLEGIVPLPLRGLKAVQHGGQITFVSDTGRFVFTGQLMDVWQGKVLGTLAEIRQAATHLDLKKLGLDVQRLNPVTLGAGGKEVIAFVDPLSPPSRALVRSAQTLVKDYTFRFVVVPALGDSSNGLASAMACMTDPRQKLKALQAGHLKGLTVKPCDPQPYQRTLLLAQLIPIEGVPTLIAPDGRVRKGLPQHLRDWLKNKPKPQESQP